MKNRHGDLIIAPKKIRNAETGGQGKMN